MVLCVRQRICWKSGQHGCCTAGLGRRLCRERAGDRPPAGACINRGWTHGLTLTHAALHGLHDRAHGVDHHLFRNYLKRPIFGAGF